MNVGEINERETNPASAGNEMVEEPEGVVAPVDWGAKHAARLALIEASKQDRPQPDIGLDLYVDYDADYGAD